MTILFTGCGPLNFSFSLAALWQLLSSRFLKHFPSPGKCLAWLEHSCSCWFNSIWSMRLPMIWRCRGLRHWKKVDGIWLEWSLLRLPTLLVRLLLSFCSMFITAEMGVDCTTFWFPSICLFAFCCALFRFSRLFNKVTRLPSVFNILFAFYFAELPHSGLIQSSIMALYIVFLTWSALNNSPVQECKPTWMQTKDGDTSLSRDNFISLLICFGCILYSVIRISNYSDDRDVEILPHDGESANEAPVADENFSSYPKFYLILALGTLYLMMVLTNWYRFVVPFHYSRFLLITYQFVAVLISLTAISGKVPVPFGSKWAHRGYVPPCTFGF